MIQNMKKIEFINIKITVNQKRIGVRHNYIMTVYKERDFKCLNMEMMNKFK